MHSQLITMDPGAKKLGLAKFLDGVLVWADTLEATEDRLPEYTAEWIRAKTSGRDYDFVTERMHKRPAQSLFDEDLDRVEACRLKIPRILRRRGFTRTYNPTAWKGNTAKGVHQERCRKVLSPEERLIWDTLGHDARDAVAIGLFHLGRVERGGLAPGPKRSNLIPSLPPPPPLEK